MTYDYDRITIQEWVYILTPQITFHQVTTSTTTTRILIMENKLQQQQ